MAYDLTPRRIMAAAQARGWIVKEIDPTASLYSLTDQQGTTRYVRNVTSIKSSSINKIIADRKDLFFVISQKLQVPVPDTLVLSELDQTAAETFMQKHGKIVVKPSDQAHGKGVTVNIETTTQLSEALETAFNLSPRILLQQQVTGSDYRLLYIDKKLAAAAIRKPAYVVGDGVSTIQQLIAIENTSGKRGRGYQTKLTMIDEAAAKTYLGDAINSIVPSGEERQVVGTANVGRGGVAIDVTATVRTDLTDIAETIVNGLDMGLCGVDIMDDPVKGPKVIEINAGPSFGLHMFPFEGESQDVPEKFLDWLAK